MDTIFYSLHDFMVHTKSITYLLVGLYLLGIGGFWYFLSERDENIRKF